MPCPRTQQANLPACSPQPPINAERQTGKLWIPFFKVFWYGSTREIEPLFFNRVLVTYATAVLKHQILPVFKRMNIGKNAQRQATTEITPNLTLSRNYSKALDLL